MPGQHLGEKVEHVPLDADRTLGDGIDGLYGVVSEGLVLIEAGMRSALCIS
jgi:hypothetical protein